MTITENTNLSATLGYIAGGDFDDDLDRVAQAVTHRKATIAMSMKIGDRVRLSDNVRPKYLAGLPGVITGKNLKRGKASFTVEIDEAFVTRQIIESRYLTGGCLSGPASLFEKVEDD